MAEHIPETLADRAGSLALIERLNNLFREYLSKTWDPLTMMRLATELKNAYGRRSPAGIAPAAGRARAHSRSGCGGGDKGAGSRTGRAGAVFWRAAAGAAQDWHHGCARPSTPETAALG
eukprot:519670-Rhodomonas_salina.3